MSYNCVFTGWDRVVPGREAASMQLFQDFLQYLGRLQAEGAIDSFETVLLNSHGGDLNGFTLIRGEEAKLDAVQATEEWGTFDMRAGYLLERNGTVRGATGDLIMQRMAMWGEMIAG